MGLGSGKNLFRFPDPGVKKAPDPRSGSATLELDIIFGLKDIAEQNQSLYLQVNFLDDDILLWCLYS
jgi:hypothetical protein